jgi:hypothetical protein
MPSRTPQGTADDRMRDSNRPTLESRVTRAATAALADHQYVTALDVLHGIGWLVPSHADLWRQGREPCLEAVVQANPSKISDAMRLLQDWAQRTGLRPSETVYLAQTRDRRPLQFSVSGDPAIEQAYRTQWVSPALSEAKQRRLAEKQARGPDLVVIDPLNEDWTCTECGGTGGLLFMEGPGPLCLACADLDHLVYLPAGDAAVTRRAKKASGLSAVVVRFSRARKRYERQGVLVEEAALEQAELSCLADEEARRRRRERDEQRRSQIDKQFEGEFAAKIRELFPGSPPDRAEAIAARAAERSSGRVGRTAAGRAFERDAITLAVVASIRHEDTAYDDLLMSGLARAEARGRIRAKVEEILDGWRLAEA